MQYRLIRDFKDGFYDPALRAIKIKDPNAKLSIEDVKQARTQFLGIIGMTSLVAGMSGLPMFWAVEAIANSLLGDEDEPRDVKAEGRKLLFDATSEYVGEIWGERLADAIMRGPWTAFTQMDLSQRASLNNLWMREIPEHLNGGDLALHVLGEVAGPIWGVVDNAFEGVETMQRGHLFRGMQKLMPKAVSDAMKTIRFATQGAQTYSQDIIMHPDEFSTYELFIQFIGFSPAELTRRYEQNRDIKDMEMRLKRRHKHLVDTLFRAYNFQDRALARETMQKIGKWNRSNPRYPISGMTILQSAKMRQDYDMRTVGGVSVDKRLQYLQRELRYTRRPKR